MNKAQKIILLVMIVLIMLMFLYPPYFKFSGFSDRNYIADSGWDWIFNLTAKTYYKIVE